MTTYDQKRINFFSNATSKHVNSFITISEYLNDYVREGLYGHKEKVLAIQGKIIQDSEYGHTERYKEDKKKLPCVVLHAQFEKYLETKNLNLFNGLLFLDFEGLTPGEITELKSFLQTLPYIIACYQSLSMHGIHAVMAIEGVNSANDYHSAYRHMTVLFYRLWNKYKLCPGANAKTQLTIMSYDPDAYLNGNATPFTYSFDKFIDAEYYVHFPKNQAQNNFDLGIYSTDSLFDIRQFNFYNRKLGRRYYANLILEDKSSGMPVPAGIKFDITRHNLKKYFTQEQIEKVELHNESRTLALFDEKISCVGINLWELKRFRHGSRTNTIMATMMDYALINKYFKHDSLLSIDEFYCLACVLNQRCITSGDNPVMYPLRADRLMWIANCVFNAYASNTITPSQRERASIYSDELFSICKGNMDETNRKSILFSELSKLKSKKTKDINDQLIYSSMNDILVDLNKKDKLISKTDLKKEIKLQTGKSLTAIERRLAEPANSRFPDNTLFRNTLCTKSELAGLQIEACISRLIGENCLISQVIISQKTGIGLRSIQRKWESYKDKVNHHNKSHKEIMKNEQEKLIKQVKELLLEMEFESVPRFTEQEVKIARQIKFNVFYYNHVQIPLINIRELVRDYRTESIDYDKVLSAGVALTEESPFKNELNELIGIITSFPEEMEF